MWWWFFSVQVSKEILIPHVLWVSLMGSYKIPHGRTKTANRTETSTLIQQSSHHYSYFFYSFLSNTLFWLYRVHKLSALKIGTETNQHTIPPQVKAMNFLLQPKLVVHLNLKCDLLAGSHGSGFRVGPDYIFGICWISPLTCAVNNFVILVYIDINQHPRKS